MNGIKNFMTFDDIDNILSMPETQAEKRTVFNKNEIETTLSQMFKLMYDYSNDDSLDIDHFNKYLDWSNQHFVYLLTIRKGGYDFEADFGSFGQRYNTITDEAIEELFDDETNDFVPFEKDENREIYNKYKCELYKSVAEYLAIKHLEEQNPDDDLF